MTPDPWGRDQLPSAVDDAADVMCGYERQLELQLNKTVDATQEQIDEWQDKELKWWADKQLNIVAIMSVGQIVMLGLMGLVMLINQIVFK